MPKSYYTRGGSIPIQGPKAPKAPQGPKTPQPTMVIQVERTQKRVGPLTPADYEKEK